MKPPTSSVVFFTALLLLGFTTSSSFANDSNDNTVLCGRNSRNLKSTKKTTTKKSKKSVSLEKKTTKKSKKGEKKEAGKKESKKNKKYKEIYLVRHGEKIEGDVEAGQLAYEAQCLSEMGWGRAYNLASIFGKNPRPPYRTPDAVFSGNYGEPLDCRDHNGWFRTQQLVSVVADHISVEVDNSTGWLPHLCNQVWNPSAKPGYIDHKASQQNGHYANVITEWVNKQPESADSLCYTRNFGAPVNQPQAGMCCNRAAANKMLNLLNTEDTILVGWEHANIGFLSTALSQDTIQFDASEWPNSEFDLIYKFRYELDGEGELAFVPPHIVDHQNFTWLGSQTYCGAVSGTEYPVEWPETAVKQGRVSPFTNFTYNDTTTNSNELQG